MTARLLAAALAAATVAASPAMSMERPARVVSLNMCTDQLLLDLAQPDQIAGLSPFAGNPSMSWAASRSTALPLLSGTAEEVMLIRPDLVVAGRFTKRATREFIRERGIPVEEFDVAGTLADTRAQISRFGEITGARDKARRRIAEIDAAEADLRAAAVSSRMRVLPLSRRGWASGRETLMADLLAMAGLDNAAGEIGLRSGGFVTLEEIVRLRPDAILVSRDDDRAEDQGRAMLLHPAVQGLFPPERRIVIPERLTVCGGPMVAEAMRLLAAQVRRLAPREAARP
ncbi:MAG: ABC transporter substrate-binding protein [Burkholderiales bacterium]|nr:ABC transporter substrate-binding protein [Burkholderiales bacterium]